MMTVLQRGGQAFLAVLVGIGTWLPGYVAAAELLGDGSPAWLLSLIAFGAGAWVGWTTPPALPRPLEA